MKFLTKILHDYSRWDDGDVTGQWGLRRIRFEISVSTYHLSRLTLHENLPLVRCSLLWYEIGEHRFIISFSTPAQLSILESPVAPLEGGFERRSLTYPVLEHVGG